MDQQWPVPTRLLDYPGFMTWSIQHFEWFEQTQGQQKYIICFDGDSAGRHSARRLAEAMLSKGLDGEEIIEVPDNMDINKMVVARQR